jgi:hypothetical protein
MRKIMTTDGSAGGAFSLQIESEKASLKAISLLATWRSKYLNLVYGDQAIFVRADIFRKMGGFSPLISKNYCVRLFPGVKKSVLSIKCGKNGEICRVDRGLGFLSTKKSDGYLKTIIWSSGDFSIYKDEFTPIVKGKREYYFRSVNGEKSILFTLKEKGSGVRRKDISLEFDGKKRDFGYFSQDRKIEIPIYEWDGGGEHNYRLEVCDRSKNKRVVSGIIRIGSIKNKKSSRDFPPSKIKVRH